MASRSLTSRPSERLADDPSDSGDPPETSTEGIKSADSITESHDTGVSSGDESAPTEPENAPNGESDPVEKGLGEPTVPEPTEQKPTEPVAAPAESAPVTEDPEVNESETANGSSSGKPAIDESSKSPEAQPDAEPKTPKPESSGSTESHDSKLKSADASEPTSAAESTAGSPTHSRKASLASSRVVSSASIRQKRRSPSLLSTMSTSSGHSNQSAVIFIKKALDSIKASKDARKLTALEPAVSKALKQLGESPESTSPTVVFEPFRIICTQNASIELKITALDCIAKLFTFSYFEDVDTGPSVDPETGITPPPSVPMIDRVVSTICDNFSAEDVDPRVELQIIKALLAAVLNEDLILHGKTLLNAIRRTYFISVRSLSTPNQAVAQVTLTQMVNTVFERVKNIVALGGMNASGSSGVVNKLSSVDTTKSEDTKTEDPEASETAPSETSNHLTLSGMTAPLSADDYGDDTSLQSADTEQPALEESDLFIKDAFLAFRTMCLLTEKPLEGDGTNIKLPGVRTKLLTLHLVHTILKTHMSVFASDRVYIKSSRGKEKFVSAIKDYVCSMLARNAASISIPVFEISAEIFWLIVSNLRSQFKREIQVFLAEIYFPIAEMKTSSLHQKQYFLSIIQRLCNDPRALVEIYLNYDCDRRAPVNIYEHIIDVLVRMIVTPVHMTQLQLQSYHQDKAKSLHHRLATYDLSQPPAVAIANVPSQNNVETAGYPLEYALKIAALESLVAVLRSLLTWSQRGIAAVSATFSGVAAPSTPALASTEFGADVVGEPDGGSATIFEQDSTAASSGTSTPANGGLSSVDDPSQFASLKHRKVALSGALREFNFKPKRGLERLIREGFVSSRDPIDVARFLLTSEGLDKAAIGDFLGEDDTYNVSIMHEFVNLMDFKGLSFVDAVRIFLQAFRLPGESQKIDRYMLKFAHRYMSDNPGVFSNADTPYVLAYSIIMLNTDQHSPEVKKRMTPEEFIRNNRGINDHADLPAEFLLNIFSEIQNNEIKLLSEQHAALLSSTGTQRPGGFAANFGLALATIGRDVQREAYMQASQEMSNKTEQLFKRLISQHQTESTPESDTANGGSADSIFYIASHIEHVKPMFEFAWMSVLAGLSGPFQESDEPDVVKLCMEGIRLSIRIACLFDIELARISFVSALAKFTNLQNLNEMKLKNIEAVTTLLRVALTEGNMLKSSWKDILTCISQLERFHLIAGGIEAGSIPDVTNARLAVPRASTDRPRNSTSGGFFSSFSGYAPGPHSPLTAISPDVIRELQASNVEVDMDKIFTQSSQLSGEAIVSFVKALTEVSWEEVQSSGDSEHPRMFSLQKMVDVSYYNMDRIRLEWSQLWSIMGEQFNQMGCHSNANVVSFALDSLRQLSLRFFDLEELPHFRFQKDFLKPFEYTMEHNKDIAAKDLVLACLQQMILAKADRIRSGWAALFAVFGTAARVQNTSIVNSAFALTKTTYDQFLPQIIAQDSFGALMQCLASIAKNPRYQKTSLHAVELIHGTVSRISELKGNPDASVKDEHQDLWFPILFSLHEVIMNGEDLEVRSRALNYLFDTLVEFGGQFQPEFWDSICRRLLFPIFVVLKSRTSKTPDELSVWLSTTMIQALRNMIALLTHYFDTLERMLDGFLELLVTCIDQENDTVSRIGSSCLQQLVVQNVSKLQPQHWTLIVDKIEHLFKGTTANELLDNSLVSENGSSNGASIPELSETSSRAGSDEELAVPQSGSRHNRTLSQSSSDGLHRELTSVTPSKTTVDKIGHHRSLSRSSNTSGASRSKKPTRFRATIIKSILQLLMIDTAEELLREKVVFDNMPTDEILRIAKCLCASYLFARKFNGDRERRLQLWRQGFMKQMPNLLKQESTSALTYVTVMMKLYKDDAKLADGDRRHDVGIELVPLCVEIIKGYNRLEHTDHRYVNTLGPVVSCILDEYYGFQESDFDAHVVELYPEIVGLLSKDLSPELRVSIQAVLIRIGEIRL